MNEKYQIEIDEFTDWFGRYKNKGNTFSVKEGNRVWQRGITVADSTIEFYLLRYIIERKNGLK